MVRIPILALAIGLALGAASLRAQDPEATRDDARWLEDCRDDDKDRDHERGHGERACEVLVESVPTAAESIVIESSRNGAVEVRGWDGPGIEVHARIQAHDDTQSEALEQVRSVQLELSPGRVRALGADRMRGAVSFEVLIPRRSGLEVSTHNGPLKVRGIEGVLRLKTDNGPLGLVDVAGDVVARATNGPLSVKLTGDRWRGAGLDAQTVNGPVHLEIPEDYSAELEVATTHGPVDIDLPMTLQGARPGEPQHFKTRLGSGGPPVKVTTTNGPLSVRRS